mmetsp:Transcript_9285/g.16983  ORF Transcript_9285/g.16983 Transcript_9285/m.16983 type:complete len:508 (+) Transcript_9285:101-1624(+)|eukprot:CAMPEP_0197522310 /NCGR_PEP_ID=MMETSP1318-20131121/7466_1 /TAXON_ID=552666 /ORGANISM="Partenskyella glossopodia, Strain RCC365" /LENGTH=507 /DNA_ID=CAMNT_0043074647 /DNA_START=307 /DNA_END=1833 /DNA_ORIENTATION=+
MLVVQLIAVSLLCVVDGGYAGYSLTAHAPRTLLTAHTPHTTSAQAASPSAYYYPSSHHPQQQQQLSRQLMAPKQQQLHSGVRGMSRGVLSGTTRSSSLLSGSRRGSLTTFNSQTATPNTDSSSSSSSGSVAKSSGKSGGSSKLAKRIVTGWVLAFAGTAVIFSGDILYSLVLFSVAMMAQFEYFSTVIKTSVNPARRISFVTSLAMYVCACKFPMQHQLGLPLGFAAVVMWFLVMRPKPGSIADISTTIMGLVYTGLLPSYWARLRCMKDVPGLKQSLVTTLDSALRWASPIPVANDVISQGAITYWFTALGCALSDVGAYFGGKRWGKRKISEVCPAAGGASPNKTVEGFLSGATMAMVTALIGAKVMGWPSWAFSGALYGVMVSVINLLGDLMASMLKRDAGVKDFGNIFPGHGGVLDRLDSYIFIGPAAYAYVTLFLPFVERMGATTTGLGVVGLMATVTAMVTISRREFWTAVMENGENGMRSFFNQRKNDGGQDDSGPLAST